MKLQKGSKTAFSHRHSGTKCTKNKGSVPLEKSVFERMEAGHRNIKLIPRQ